jgi:hypothetical protein
MRTLLASGILFLTIFLSVALGIAAGYAAICVLLRVMAWRRGGTPPAAVASLQSPVSN